VGIEHDGSIRHGIGSALIKGLSLLMKSWLILAALMLSLPLLATHKESDYHITYSGLKAASTQIWVYSV